MSDHRREKVLVDSVSRWYRTGDCEVAALTNVNLSISSGEFVSVVGPSGAGKSTLMHLMGALDRPTSGKIFVDGCDLTEMDERTASNFRLHHVGFVFQFFNLLPHLSAWENVVMPTLFDGSQRKSGREEAVRLLESVGMGNRVDHRPAELSGGQMQRVAIARALIMNPRIVLADEPTGNLDSKTGAEILSVLQEVVDSKERVVVIVTHDSDAAAAADRTIEMRDGAIVGSKDARAC